MTVLDSLQSKLEKCISERHIPGASVTIYQNGNFTQAVAGTININTLQPVIPETIFMIGSITKILTATLLMQLVDEGIVDLNAPAIDYLPASKVASEVLKKEITIAILLNHTSGIDGDFFDDTGNNSDSLEKYVAAMNKLDYLHPVGKMRAYNNAAYNLIGRIVEKLLGREFSLILRERLLQPIGLLDDVINVSEHLRYSSAVGHVKNQGSQKTEIPKKIVGSTNQVAMGSVLAMSSLSLAKIGQFYLNDGVTQRGERLVLTESLDYLKSNTEGTFNYSGSRVWASYQGSGMTLFNHYGGICGQNSWLGILPEKDLAISVLTNYQSGAFEVELNLLPEILEELGGFKMDSQNSDTEYVDLEPQPDKYIGVYQRYSMDIEIRLSTDDNHHIQIKIEDKEDGELNLGPEEWYELKSVSNTDFEIIGQTLLPVPLIIHFYEFEEAEYPVLEYFGRPHKRVL